MSELKPCPFCGTIPESGSFDDETYSIRCSNNQCAGSPSTCECATAAEAIAAWNTRSTPDLAQVREKLEAACKEMMHNGAVIGRPHLEHIRFDLTLMVGTIMEHLTKKEVEI